jgi:hypothetical protein
LLAMRNWHPNRTASRNRCARTKSWPQTKLIGGRSTTEPPSAIKLHAVKSPALLALRSRCGCSPTLLPGRVGAGVGLRPLL